MFSRLFKARPFYFRNFRNFSSDIAVNLDKLSDIPFSTLANKFDSVEKNKIFQNIIDEYINYKSIKKTWEQSKEFENEILNSSNDTDIIKMLNKDLDKLKIDIQKSENAIDDLIIEFCNEIHQETEDSVILEIISGVGGEDAEMFANDLLQMYTNYCEYKNWKFKLISSKVNDYGGIKDALCSVEGLGVLNLLSFERGVHRVSRVPFNADKIHTSAASVVVTPKNEQIKVSIDRKDLKYETMLSSGPGGQNVQKRHTAIRITHIPSGIRVHVSKERKCELNKMLALEMIQSQLYLQEYKKFNESEKSERLRQKGIGERHEKIRSYSFQNNKIIDHRANINLNYNLLSKKNLIAPEDLDDLINKIKIGESQVNFLKVVSTLLQ